MVAGDKLGAVFRQLRSGKRWSQERMAKALEIHGASVRTRAGVCRLERRGTKQYSTLKAYSEICDVSMREMERMAETFSLCNSQ